MEKVSRQVFKVPDCPKCKLTHEYNLKIRRSIVKAHHGTHPDRKKSIKRLFTCPNTEEDFEVTFILKTNRLRRILSVEVTGVRKKAKSSK